MGGMSTKPTRLPNPQAAIDFIKRKSPEHIKAQQAAADEQNRKEMLKTDLEEKRKEVEERTTILTDAQAKAKETEALAAAGTNKSETCAWMFADAASGLLGFNELVHLNPLRWSGLRTFDKAKGELDVLVKDSTAAQRPILLKVSGVDQTKYANAQEAIDFLMKSLGEVNEETSAAENNNLEAKAVVADAEARLTEAKTAVDAAKDAADAGGVVELAPLPDFNGSVSQAIAYFEANSNDNRVTKVLSAAENKWYQNSSDKPTEFLPVVSEDQE